MTIFAKLRKLFPTSSNKNYYVENEHVDKFLNKLFFCVLLLICIAIYYAPPKNEIERVTFVQKCAEHRSLEECERDGLKLYPKAD